MWFLTSFGRPELLARLVDAPGGWPDRIVLFLTYGDPCLKDYLRFVSGIRVEKGPIWDVHYAPAESRLTDIYKIISQEWHDLAFYGLLHDDHWPITPGWHEKLVEAAGLDLVSTPNGEPNFPLLRNVMVVGGDLMRAVGSLAPSKVKHNFCDNVWDTIVRDFDALAPLKDVFVEHRHPHHGLAKEDATYKRGSSDYIKDEVIYRNWLSGKDRMDMNERVAKLFGKTVATVKTEDINLVIGVPMQDETVDIAFHSSINRTITSFGELGIKLNVLQTSGGSHIGKARERVLWEAMAFNPTHIMFIDADMGWEPNQITRLLCADHEFSAVAGVKKVDELKICANFLEQQNLHDKSKFLEVRDVGFAFVMLKRSVIEKMCAAYPELAYNAGKDKTEFALFLDMIDDRERLSEDFSFCRRWRAMGGKIWLDADQGIIHAGRKQYTGKVSDLFTYEKKAEAA